MNTLCELDIKQVLQELHSNAFYGLTTGEAQQRLKRYGSNEQIEQLRSVKQIIWEQVSATIIIVLIASAIVTPLFGDYKEAIGIIVMIVLICCLGFTQDYRAQKAIMTLKKLSVPNVKVLRDGYIQEISTSYLVPGDVIHLETEDIVPADCQILESQDFRVRESPIQEMHKEISEIENSPNFTSSIYQGSVVIRGQAKAIVRATGINTELGRLNVHNTTKPSLTPLQLSLGKLGQSLTIVIFCVVGIIFALGILRGEDPKEMFLTAITLVVAALPEGLTAVVTISLALGARSLLKRRTLVRNLSSVEKLGFITVIGSGKTGMNNPARREIRNAVVNCVSAGIRPMMITPEHPLKAINIAKDININTKARVVTGNQFGKLPKKQLARTLKKVSVYARVSPTEKLTIVESLKRRGHVVAITGKGIDDIPTLNTADIGIAMGLHGTNAVKEAADIVLLDDNFASIVAAVKQGRVIYDNIRKFIKYLLSSNIGELLVMLVAPFLGMPLPLSPLQILWINLATDGLPALALSLEPAERNIMNRPPYPTKENIFSRGMGKDILWIGLLLGTVSLGTAYVYWKNGADSWQTILLTVLTLSQMGNALASRSERESLFKIGLFSNKTLLWSVTLTLVVQLVIIYVPFFAGIFSTTPLSGADLIVCLGLSSIVFCSTELKKLF
jgi:magnesium-transporting ATPase (P-type)